MGQATGKRFKKLKFPVHTLEPRYELKIHPRFDILFQYPEFRDFSKNKPDLDLYRNRLIRFICFMYDPESDLIEEFPAYKDRKEAAIAEAVFVKDENGEYAEFVKSCLDFEEDRFTNMILRFLRVFNNNTWTEINTLEMEYDRYTEIRWKVPEDSQKLGVLCGKILKDLKALKKEFFQGDIVLEEKVMEEKVTPENVTRIFELENVEDVQAN